MVDALTRLAEDPKCVVAVLTGNGPYYSSGHDLRAMQSLIGAEDLEKALTDATNAQAKRFVRVRYQPIACHFVHVCDASIGMLVVRRLVHWLPSPTHLSSTSPKHTPDLPTHYILGIHRFSKAAYLRSQRRLLRHLCDRDSALRHCLRLRVGLLRDPLHASRVLR